jgi:general secretion pathway protein L
MSAGTIFTRWIDVLAGLAVGWREQWLGHRVLTIAHEKEGLVFRRKTSGKNVVLAFVQDGAPLPEAVVKASRDALVVLELAPEKVVQGRLSLPAQAREFLPGIVRNQIERLSPWKADQAVYGYEVAEGGEGGLDVSVSITSRGVVDGARDELAKTGLAADRVVVRSRDEENGRSVPLWSRATDSPGESLARARRAIGAGLAACVLGTAAVSGWAVNASATMQAESEELALRLRALQRQVQGARAATARTGPNPLERAWAAKEAAPSAVITLEALSRILPETAYLTDLNIEGPLLRIIGLTSDAPALIAPLEASGHLTEVRFFAPTTRNAEGTHFRFHIEAKIQPRLEVAVR